MPKLGAVKLFKQIKIKGSWKLAPALFDTKGPVRRDHVRVQGRDELPIPANSSTRTPPIFCQNVSGAVLLPHCRSIHPVTWFAVTRATSSPPE
jgi:hypothetical protein